MIEHYCVACAGPCRELSAVRERADILEEMLRKTAWVLRNDLLAHRVNNALEVIESSLEELSGNSGTLEHELERRR